MEQRASVVLVDELGCDLRDDCGRLCTLEKIEAHRRGLLHRAVSVFIFNDRNELLLQRRAGSKYHSPDKWSNTCCTHPFPGEPPLAAARRRLFEEMGLMAPLTEVFVFLYKAEVGDGLIEHEVDHVLFGISNCSPSPNTAEVSGWRWMTMENLRQSMTAAPENYSSWFRQCFGKVLAYKLEMSKSVLDLDSAES